MATVCTRNGNPCKPAEDQLSSKFAKLDRALEKIDREEAEAEARLEAAEVGFQAALSKLKRLRTQKEILKGT